MPRTAGPDTGFTTGKDIERCKLSCCKKCSFCARALTKERAKSRAFRMSDIKKLQIKICEQCFLCHSITCCPTCSKCPQCCSKSICRGQTSKLLANLVENGGRSEGSSNPERGLYPPLPDPTQTLKVTYSHKPLCQSPQEQLPVGGITSAYRQKCSGAGPQSNISGFLQPTVLSPQAQQQVAAYLRPEQPKSFSPNGEIQDGNTRNHQNIPSKRGVGHLSRFQRRLLPHTNTGTIEEVSQISHSGPDLPIQGTSLWSINSAHGIQCIGKGSKTDGHPQGYKDPPVPRRLVGEGQIPKNLSATHANSGRNVPESRLASEPRKIRAGTQASFRLCGLSVRPQVRSGQTYSGPVAEPPGQDKISLTATDLSGPAVYVSDRTVNGHRKAGSPRPVTHETYTVASQKQLESTGISREDHSSTQVPSPPLTLVATGKQRAERSAVTPYKTCSASLYRRIKRRVGRSLKRAHCKRVLVGTRKQVAYKLPGTKSSFPSLKRVSGSLRRQDSPSGNRQYYSGGLHKQGRRHEVGPPLCPSVENPDLVFPETGDSESPTHPRLSKCDSGQAIQVGSDHPDRVVPPPRNFPKIMQQMAPTTDRSVCHEVQSQTTSVCVSNFGLPGYSSGCTHSAMGGLACICLPTNRHFGQSGGKATGLPLQEGHSNCPGVAQHALVLGPGDHVQSGPSQAAQSAKSIDTALQSDPSQKSDQPKPSCMAPRASAIKQQGFSEAVAARIEAPQRGSTRSVYEAKWTIFTKWCLSNQVDFQSPPLKSVADFLLYLFEVKKLQPSTIDGYRSAIADKLGNDTVNISKDDNLTRLLDSFHRDRPKGRRGIPSWNLSLVLHQLTKAPFEPLREASLKHLTFKTVFLLALGSGKRRRDSCLAAEEHQTPVRLV